MIPKQAIISRKLIHENYTLINLCFGDNTLFDREKIIEMMDRWHTVFDHFNLQKGDRVTYIDEFDGISMAFFIAACERGLTFCMFRNKEFAKGVDYEKYGLDLKFVAYGELGSNRCDPDWNNVIQFNTDKLSTFKPCDNPNIVHDPDAPIYISGTSGTTGEPTTVTHTHRSMLTASYKSVQLFYEPLKSKPRTVMVSHFHHAGVMSIQFLPTLIVGAECYFVLYNDIFKYIDKVKPNICLLFEVQMQLGRLNMPSLMHTLDLSSVETVLTGGSMITQSFLEFLLSKGVGTVYDVYGATQSLVPVLYSRYNNADLRTGFMHKIRCIRGTNERRPIFTHVAKGWYYGVDPNNGELMLKGDALSVENDNGEFYRTGDCFEFIDGMLAYSHRLLKPLTSKSGTIIQPNAIIATLMKELSLPKGVSVKVTKDTDDNIILNLKNIFNRLPINISLEQVNDVLVGKYGRGHTIDILRIESNDQNHNSGDIK